ncbi:MAG: hypothetical protein HZA15_07660 [Nitrospirae bacterium]|nr:hypothetical protein [Nitrospirota bacterium]
MSRTNCLSKWYVLILTALLVAPAVCVADSQDFLPRLFSIGGDLDINSHYESDTNRSAERETKTADLFIRERLSLYTDGFIYHPRFIQFHVMLAAGLKQEDYETTFDQKSSHASSMEYDLSTALLPEHPYSLYLFTRRMEPLSRQQFSTLGTTVEYSTGGRFRYEARPYFVQAQVIRNSDETDLWSSTTTAYNATAVYYQDFKEFNFISHITLNSWYDHSTFSSSSGVSGTKDEYGINALLKKNGISLNSMLSGANYDQADSGNTPVVMDQFSLHERLNAALPLGFRTELSYKYQKNNRRLGEGGDIFDRDMSTRENRFDLLIGHRLFQSLDTLYQFRLDDLASSTGGVLTATHSLLSNYTKKIPWGRVTAGINLSSTIIDQTGQTGIASETYRLGVPGSFTLNSQNIEQSSISVYLKSPLPPFEVIRLNEGVDYTVMPLGSTVQINVINLPAPFVVPETYDFIISFSLDFGDFKSQKDSYGANVNFNLFDNMLSPYYSRQVTKQKLISGDMSGIPYDATADTVGVIFQKDPYRLMGEYIRFDSTLSPYQGYRIEGSYSRSITETTRLLAAALYSSRRYPHGTSFEVVNGYTERIGTVSASIQKRFPMQNLFISAGGSYSQTKSVLDMSVATVNTSLQWMLGKLAVNFGASYSLLESQGLSSDKVRRTHQNVFLNIRRKLL